MGLAFVFYLLGFLLLVAGLSLYLTKRAHRADEREEIKLVRKLGFFIARLLSDSNDLEIIGWRKYSSAIALGLAALACFAASLVIQSTV